MGGTKQYHERRIFDALAPLIGISVIPGSVRQPDPPDIVCDVVARGPLAVELVAIDATGTRMRLENMVTTDEAWRRALTRRPIAEQERISADTSNVFFSISFDNGAGLRDRTAALHAIQSFLLDHPGHVGLVPPALIGRSRGLGATTVHRRGVPRGPRFSHFSAGAWFPPQIEQIEKKLLNRAYATNVPLELFAYATHDEPDGAVGLLEAIQASVLKHLPGSNFQRVHLFHLGFLKHICSMP